MLVEVTLLVVAVVLLLLYWIKDPPGIPPGPRRYPVIGTLKQILTTEDALRLQKEYGSINSTVLGSQRSVQLCDYITIKKAFSRLDLSDRPDWKCLNFLSDGKMAGVLFRNGQEWQTLRRFLLRQLRDMGMGKSRLDDVIVREAEVLVQDFRNHTQEASFFPVSISICTLNIIWQLVASQRYELDDETIKDFLKRIRQYQEDLPALVLPDIFPWLNYLPRFLFKKIFKEDKLWASVKIAKAMMEEVVREHRANLDPASPRDVLDEFLLEMDRQKDDPHTVFNETDMIKTIFDLFLAGFDTTSNTLRWVILYMADQPAVQERVQQELDDVVPRDVLPSHIHRPRLPYLDATLNEVLRASSLAPMGVPHVAVSDTHIDGFFIPKGTFVNGCNAVCHVDPKYWDKPEEFQPERFLDESGKLRTPKESFIPFGTGKRSCLGEALARMELYVFSAALLQNFTFAPPEECKVDMDPLPLPGQRFPKDQKLIIKARK